MASELKGTDDRTAVTATDDDSDAIAEQFRATVEEAT